MGRWIVCGLLVVALAGCGQSAAVKKMKGSQREPYPEFDALGTAEPAMALGYAQSPAEMKKAASSEAFIQMVADFEKSTPPAGYDPALKDALVAAYKDVIETAKTGKPDDLKAKIAAMRAATGKLGADPNEAAPQ